MHEVLGGELAFVADNDPGAAAVLAHHFPDVPNLGDIRTVDWVSLGDIDVLGGGFPCTDVSQAGARAGLLRGNRSGIWHEFATAIGVLRPGLVVIENVLGLLTARGDEPTAEHLAAEASRDAPMRMLGWLDNELALAVSKGNTHRARQVRARAVRLRKMRKQAEALCQWHEKRLIRAAGTVLADLAGLGYDAEWAVVTAAAAGACHRRARLFILAFPAAGRSIPGEPVAVIAGGAWLEPLESLFGSAPFTGRIPASGRMYGGLVYAAPDGPTGIGGGLLKTPTAQLAVNGGSQHPDKRRAGGHGPTLADQVEHELLPTPTARLGDDTSRGADAARYKGPKSLNGRRSNLDDCIAAVTEHSPWLFKPPVDADPAETAALLPTPAARDGKGRDKPGREGGKSLPETLLPTRRASDGTEGGPNQRGSSGDLMLPSAVMGLLPTPTAADGDRVSLTYPRGNETLLGALLPTPQAHDAVKGKTPEQVKAMRERGRIGGHAPGVSNLNEVVENGLLLPTPSVADGTGGHTSRSGTRKGEPLLGGIGMLLPTPVVTDAKGAWNATAGRSADKAGVNSDGWTLADVIWQGDLPLGADAGRLLPPPAAGNFNDGESAESWQQRKDFHAAKDAGATRAGLPLTVAAQQIAGTVDWGAYEAAVRRWEAVTGRLAPSPTVPGRTGERLNPALPEWMMGLPEGWITGVPGLSRNAQLKLAGNGCVPQQVTLALTILLARAGINLRERAA